MLFLVVCVFDEGVYPSSFRVVEAASRQGAAQHIVDDRCGSSMWIIDHPDVWATFLRDAGLYEAISRGDAPYYAEPRPP